MKLLDLVLTKIYEDSIDLDFSDTLKMARQTLGIIRYRISEITEIPLPRLKNLENGEFKTINDIELKRLSDLYQIPFHHLKCKAEIQLNKKKLYKEIDDESSMPRLQSVQGF